MVYAGLSTPEDRLNNITTFPQVTIAYLGPDKVLPLKEYMVLFRNYLSSRTFDFYLIEYVFLSFVISFLPKNGKTILDAHDLIGERIDSFRKFGYLDSLVTDIDPADEYSLFGEYDYVMCIEKGDYQKVSQIIGKEKTLYTPHPATGRRRNIRKSVSNIGFIASNYTPNVDAVKWFLENVWNNFEHNGVHLNVYGTVVEALQESRQRNVNRIGYTKDIDMSYNELDIVVNPVRFGAGLKIKNIEALSNGLPLITTTHGSKGIEDGKNVAFMVADDGDSFTKVLGQLIDDTGFRAELAESAYQYAQSRFSPEICFDSLLSVLSK